MGQVDGKVADRHRRRIGHWRSVCRNPGQADREGRSYRYRQHPRTGAGGQNAAAGGHAAYLTQDVTDEARWP